MNKIIIKGRLVRTPELKTGASGIEFCNVTVAVDRRVSKEKMKDKQSDFFDCTAFGKTAAFVNAYFKKGQEILIEGRMESRTVEKDGNKRTYWGISVDNVEFCGSKSDNAATAAEVAEAPADPSGFTPVEVEELPF